MHYRTLISTYPTVSMEGIQREGEGRGVEYWELEPRLL